jgi:hypothetical protein
MPPPEQELEIRTASVHDVARVGLALSRAFQDDPVMEWGLPDRDRRREVLPGFFTIFAGAFQRHGHVHRTADGTGAALWVPPGVAPVGDNEAEAFGAALQEVVGPDAERMFVISELLDENHPHEPVWYVTSWASSPRGKVEGSGPRSWSTSSSALTATGSRRISTRPACEIDASTSSTASSRRASSASPTGPRCGKCGAIHNAVDEHRTGNTAATTVRPYETRPAGHRCCRTGCGGHALACSSGWRG